MHSACVRRLRAPSSETDGAMPQPDKKTVNEYEPDAFDQPLLLFGATLDFRFRKGAPEAFPLTPALIAQRNIVPCAMAQWSVVRKLLDGNRQADG